MARTQSRTSTRNRTAPAEQTSAIAVVDPRDRKERADKLTQLVDERRDQLIAFLQADEAGWERFRSVALDAVIRDPNLLAADGLSLLQSIRHAAIMGLEPSGVMGEGAIVVYRDNDQDGKKIAQFQPMYRGLMKLARNSGEVASIGCDVVCENDPFRVVSGTEPRIEHEIPTIGDRGSIIGAYAFIRLVNGELMPLYMSVADIYKRRSVSKSWGYSGESSIWGKWPAEMMKKTVLRRLLVERAPLSFRAARALALDAAIDGTVQHVEQKRLSAGVASAPGSRTRARLTSGVDDAGAADDGKAADDAASTDSGASEASEGATDDPATEAGEQAIEVCGKPGMAEGSFCIRAPKHAEPMHVDRDGAEWL